MSNYINLKNFTIRPKFLVFYSFINLVLVSLMAFTPVKQKLGVNYLLTHKGMHAYNGNMAMQVFKKKKFKKRNKQPKLLISKPINNIKKRFKPKNKPKLKQYIRKPVAQTNQSLIEFTNWYNLVCDPIHTQYPVKVPDPISTQTHCFCDFNMVDEEISLNLSWDDTQTPNECDGVVLYMRYGPGEITNPQLYAYSVYCIPVDAGGYPILSNVSGVSVAQFQPTLYDQTWGVIDACRMVSMGMRVNSKVGISTDSTSQFVTKFFSFSMKSSDFEAWVYGEDEDLAPLVEMIMSCQDHQQFDNSGGAAARYNPLQNVNQQLAFYQQENLITTEDDGFFDTHGMTFPGIYVKFNNPIPANGLGMLEKQLNILIADLENIDPDNDNLKLQNEISRLRKLIACNNAKTKPINRNSKNIAHDKHTPHLQKLTRHRKINKYAVLQKQIDELTLRLGVNEFKSVDDEEKEQKVQNLGEEITINYVFPITFEARFWLEATIKLPSMFIAYPKPIDPAWSANLGAVVARQDKCTSDGHSFKKIFNKSVKLGKQAVKGYKAGRKFAGGMASNVRAVASDLAPLAEMAMLTL